MSKTYKTSLAGVPVIIQLIAVGPAPQEDILAMEALLEQNSSEVSNHPLPVITSVDTPVVSPVVPITEQTTVTKDEPSAETQSSADIIKSLTEDTKNTDPKPIWQSKVMWINAVAILSAVGAFFGFNLSIPTEWYPVLVAVGAGANMFFRHRGYAAPLQSVATNYKLLQNCVRHNRS